MITGYVPSYTELSFQNEQLRNSKSDFYWNERFVGNLAVLALKVIARNFKKRTIFRELSEHDQEHLQELLSTELDLEIVVPLIELESYWKRRYLVHFTPTPIQAHLGWTWKCLYLEHYITEKLENLQTEFQFESIEKLLHFCYPYIHSLSMKKLPQLEPSRTIFHNGQPQKESIPHFSLNSILIHLLLLTKLEVSCENDDFLLTVEDCEQLGDAIQNMKQLKILRLHRKEIGWKHTQKLLRKLTKNGGLVELNLSHCTVGDLGAKYIGIFLNIHEEIKILKLRDNQISADGISGIACALRMPEGSHIQELDLSLNPLGQDGCINLMQALVRGSLPQIMNIEECNIEEDVSSIVRMIRTNTSLRKLDLSRNKFGSEGGKELLEALKHNYQLQELNITETGISEEIQDEIRTILERNMANGPKNITKNLSQIISFDKLMTADANDEEIDKQIIELISEANYGDNDYIF